MPEPKISPIPLELIHRYECRVRARKHVSELETITVEAKDMEEVVIRLQREGYLIVAIEEKIQHKLGLTITLANVQVMTQEINPFSNVNTLADYIAQLLKEKKHE